MGSGPAAGHDRRDGIEWGVHRDGRRDQKVETRRRRNIMRKLVIIIAAALALGLGITGVYALAGGGSSSGAGPDLAVTSVPTSSSATPASSTPSATPRPST